jgi:uncharacterized protein
VVEALRRSRLNRSLLLVKYILDSAPDLRAAAELLSEAHDADADAVNTLLVHPWVAAWAVTCARDPSHPCHRRATDAVALAAARRAGLWQRRILVSPVAGHTMIPGSGMLAGEQPRRLAPGDLRGPGWQPIRSVSAESGGQRIGLAIDDLDPYRDCHGAAVASRLSRSQFDELAAAFAEAWALLVTYAPSRAAELARGLMSYAPLSSETSGKSATCAEAFGGLAATSPRDGLELAVTLVHEFQHSKLAALSTLLPLSLRDDRSTYFAPWRPDPRPLGSLLQGIYAFTAIASLWRDFSVSPELHAVALCEFASTRAQVRRALTGLGHDAGLTTAGRRLVSLLTAVAAEHARFPVPDDIERAATAKVARAEARWTSRRAAATPVR